MDEIVPTVLEQLSCPETRLDSGHDLLALQFFY